MKNGFVLGMDGGGTHFRIRAIDSENGKVLSSISIESIGYFSKDPSKAKQRLEDGAKYCMSFFKGSLADCRYVVCGMSGIDSNEDKELLECILSSIFPHAKIECMNDGLLALKSTTGGEGILLNSGTGSITVGINSDGKYARVGGWPYTVYGDEGSGTWISLKVIRLIGMWLDGIVDADNQLMCRIANDLCINTEKKYMDFCLHFTQKDLTIIPPLIDEYASFGDIIANEILKEAYCESFKMVKQIADILSYGYDDVFKVGVWGSNILNSPIHIEGFSRLLKLQFPNVEICFPKEDSLTFATELAFKSLSTFD